ncbi:hypothetical protein NBRC116589_18740 [Ruegeria sp. HU-ET01832]
MTDTQLRTRRAYCRVEMCDELWNLLGKRNSQPSMAGDLTHFKIDLRVFSDTSN